MTVINKLLAGGDNMIRTLDNIHALIGATTGYKISEINALLEEKQKERHSHRGGAMGIHIQLCTGLFGDSSQGAQKSRERGGT